MRKIATLVFAVALMALPLTNNPFTVGVHASSTDYVCEVTPPYAWAYMQAGSHSNAIAQCQGLVNQYAISLCSGQPDGDPFTLDYGTLYFPNGYNDPDFYYVHISSQAYKCVNGWAVYP
jgi:hypothetical protein